MCEKSGNRSNYRATDLLYTCRVLMFQQKNDDAVEVGSRVGFIFEKLHGPLVWALKRDPLIYP